MDFEEIRNTRFDVIILGAGMGGLIAGNLLQHRGYRVLILEKNPTPGGCVASFKRNGYTFDTALHFINGCKKGGMIYRVLEKFDGENLVEWIELERLLHWKDIEHNVEITTPVPMEKYLDALSERFPAEAKNIRRFYKDYKEVTDLLLELAVSSKLKAMVMPFIKPRVFARFISSVTHQLDYALNKYFKDEGLKTLLSSISNSFGYHASEMAAPLYMMSDISYRVEGAFYPKGTAGYYSEQLAKHFESKGGKILYNTEVTGLEVENKLVKAVKAVRKGENAVFQSRAVISDIDLTHLFTHICPKGSIPDSFVKKIQDRKPTFSSIMVFLGLNLDLKARGITDFEIWRKGKSKFDQVAFDRTIYHVDETQDYSNLPIEMVSIYSNVDPTCAPPGKSTVSMIYLAKLEPFLKYLDDGNKRGERYREFKKKLGDQMVQSIAEILEIPNLKDCIEVYEIATPVTYARYTGNREGSHLGWSLSSLTMLSNKSPIKNMFLGGQWVMPGGGVSAVTMGADLVAKYTQEYLKSTEKSV